MFDVTFEMNNQVVLGFFECQLINPCHLSVNRIAAYGLQCPSKGSQSSIPVYRSTVTVIVRYLVNEENTASAAAACWCVVIKMLTCCIINCENCSKTGFILFCLPRPAICVYNVVNYLLTLLQKHRKITIWA